MIVNEPYSSIKLDVIREQILSERFDDILIEVGLLLDKFVDLQDLVDLLIEICKDNPELKENLLSHFLFYKELPRCSNVGVIHKPLLENKDEKIESQTEIEIQSETLKEKMRCRSDIFQEKYTDLEVLCKKSYEDIARSYLDDNKEQKLWLKDIINDYNDIQDLKLLIGICYLYHYNEIDLVNNSKKGWCVIRNGL